MMSAAGLNSRFDNDNYHKNTKRLMETMKDFPEISIQGIILQYQWCNGWLYHKIKLDPLNRLWQVRFWQYKTPGSLFRTTLCLLWTQRFMLLKAFIINMLLFVYTVHLSCPCHPRPASVCKEQQQYTLSFEVYRYSRRLQCITAIHQYLPRSCNS
jgi:hypothetical protein